MMAARIVIAAAAGTTLLLGTSAFARATGTPQRSDRMPSGLIAAFQRDVPGLLNALARTEGSNSRLQDMPASP